MYFKVINQESKIISFIKMLLIALMLFGAILLLYFINNPDVIYKGLNSNSRLEIINATFQKWSGEDNSSAMYTIEGKVRDIEINNFVIILFSRVSNEDSWTLQVTGWPPEKPNTANLISTNEWKITIYVGNIKKYSYQKEYELYAVAVNENEASKLMNVSSKVSKGIPFFRYKFEIMKNFNNQVWSKPFTINIYKSNENSKIIQQ